MMEIETCSQPPEIQLKQMSKNLLDVEEIINTPPTRPQRSSNISVLTDNLILTMGYLINKKFVESENISCIINVTRELEMSPSCTDGIIYHKIPIFDLPLIEISRYFDEAADLIHKVAKKGGTTVVYCVAGVSRSASICLAYLMKHKRMKLLQAYNYVKERRKIIRPNCGFFEQLIEYEYKLYKKNTVKMVYNKCVNMNIPTVYDSDYNYENKIIRERFSRPNCKII